MSTASRSLAASFLALAVAVLAVMACAAVPALPAPDGPLVTFTTRGGECVDGPCGATTVIERDGRVHQTAPATAELGRLPAAVLTGLDAAIQTTDFDAIRAVPFTGECPVNVDGQEQIYEFGARDGAERLASCETAIDPKHPVFTAVAAALTVVQPLPE